MEFSQFPFLSPGSKVIDVGTWDNVEPSIQMASKGSTVYAVDKYQDMDRFRRKIREMIEEGNIDGNSAERVYALKADVCELPFANSTVNVVLFYYSLSWLEQFGTEILSAFNESLRVLKNEGIIIITETNVERAKKQERILKTQVKVLREGTLIIGYKRECEESIMDVLKEKD